MIVPKIGKTYVLLDGEVVHCKDVDNINQVMYCGPLVNLMGSIVYGYLDWTPFEEIEYEDSK